ncbi:hypothetical protein QR680_018007 [Steinernema hermaphroditum]|uniref:Uncharacterized protein n=1 Tax=Steinernema hermaphroditum TaxID=289476 RepID=A0AA39LQ47_9BILA|nr:hypothetical protein QR680_018007 [Steinernema hermaphroditum]
MLTFANFFVDLSERHFSWYTFLRSTLSSTREHPTSPPIMPMESYIPTDDNDPNCTGMAEIANSQGYKALTIGRTVIDLLGIVAIVYGLSFKMRPFLIHGNAKILVYFHVFYCILSSFGHFASHIADLIRLHESHDDPCDYTMKIWQIFSVRQLTFAGTMGQNVTIFLIAIERLISTFDRTYERNKSRKLAIIMSVVKVVFVICICYVFVLLHMNFEEKMSEFMTLRGKSTGDSIQIVTYCAMFVEFLSIILFHVLYFINLKTRVALRRNVSASRLPEAMAMKYQATENRKTISFFFPIVWTHFVLYLIRSITVTIYLKIYAYNPLNHAFYEELTNWMNLYTLFVGVMIILRFTKCGRKIKSGISKKICVCEQEFISVKAISTMQRRNSKDVDHFKQLQNMFERGTLQ